MCSTHTTLDKNQWDQLGLGIHVCAIYQNKDEQFSSLVPFFQEGFKKHERCLYIFDENTPEEIAANIQSSAPNPHTQDAPAGLEIVSSHETYMKDGSFDSDKMLSLVKEKIITSLQQGYSGVRAAGEMTWILSSDTPLETLVAYEQKLNAFYASQELIGLCQYHEDKFSPEFLIEMIRTHPYLLIRGQLYKNNYFYADPKYANESSKCFKASDYETILSIIMEDSPLITV